MRGDFITHPDEILRLRSYMLPEQIGILIISLCLSEIGEDPGDMEPVVGVVYDIFKDRIQREHEAYDKKAERNRINGRRHVSHADQKDSAATASAPVTANIAQGSMDRSGNTTKQEPDKPNTTQKKPDEPIEAGTEPNRSLPNPNPNPGPNPVSQKEICASGKPDAPSDVPEEDQGDHCPASSSTDSSSSRSSAVTTKRTNAETEALFEKLWKEYPLKRGKGKVSAAKKRELFEIGEEAMYRALRRYIDEHEAREKRGEFVPAWQNGDSFFNTGYIDYLDENYVAAPRDPPRPASTRSGFVNIEQSNTDWDAAFEQVMRLQEEAASREINKGSGA